MANPQRVLLTGASGFLGGHVLPELLRTGQAREQIQTPSSRQLDLTDRVATRAFFERTQPELVIHLAARVGGIGANQQHPGTFFRDNMLMGVHVLDEAMRAKVAKVVLVGTVCGYPKFAKVPFRESELFDGYPEETNAPYGIAKRSLFVMAEAYRKEFGLNAICLLPTNLYGPGDNFELGSSHVIPAMIRKMVDAQRQGNAPVELWGDGSPTRDFLYVQDAARAIVSAAASYDRAEPINLGSGREVLMSHLAEQIQAVVGHQGRLRWDSNRPNGQPRRVLDASSARAAIGFEPQVELTEGLRRTHQWYLENELQILDKERGRSS